MRKYTLAICMGLQLTVFSQSLQESALETSISNVTVFLEGAQITRTGEVKIIDGKSELVIKSLSPHIDEKSIQVKAQGAFTILSVNHDLNYLDELQKDEEIEQLQGEIEDLQFRISTNQARLEVLEDKMDLLDQNKNLGGENTGASLTQIKQAIDFYDREMTQIKSESLKVRIANKELRKAKNRIQQQIADISVQDELPTGEIRIRVEANETTKGSFQVTYLVANAGWYPKYDVRVSSVDQPLELQYKADVYQSTGIDWENVRLRLSNGNPNESGVAPELETWYLNFARNTIFQKELRGIMSNTVGSVSGKVLGDDGEPLPGANVVVKGTTIGTITDLNGSYSLTLPNGASYLTFSFIGYNTKQMPIKSQNMNVRLDPAVSELQEVVVMGFAQDKASRARARSSASLEKRAENIVTTVVENQTTVAFEVEDPYSIESNGEKLSVNLSTYEIEALYEYYAVPKLDPDAFLIARIVNWDQYNLLEGEANLYFEDAYVGRSILDARSLSDTLSISLGRDKSIVVGRTKIDDFSKRRTIGANKIDSRGFEILVRNKKNQPIQLTLYDQIPVAAIGDISVSTTELSGGKLDEQTGLVTWDLNLNAQEQRQMNLSYEVKYPKKEKVNLE